MDRQASYIPTRHLYQVLYLDFSKIGGGIDSLRENFDNYCNLCIDNFIKNYQHLYSPDFVKKVQELPHAVEKLNAINLEAHDREYPLFLIVDEYDNFTNVVLNEHGKKVYEALTHASGFYCAVLLWYAYNQGH